MESGYSYVTCLHFFLRAYFGDTKGKVIIIVNEVDFFIFLHPTLICLYVVNVYVTLDLKNQRYFRSTNLSNYV